MRRTERAAYRTKFYSNLSSPTQFDEEPITASLSIAFLYRQFACPAFYRILITLIRFKLMRITIFSSISP